MNRQAAGIIASLALATAALPVQAAEFGVYAGGFYSETSKDADRNWFVDEVADTYRAFGITPLGSETSFETDDSGYGFVVGYRMLEHLAIEGGYMDLGEVTYRDAGPGIYQEEQFNFRQRIKSGTSGLAVSALGIWPLSYRWEVYGRAGVLISSNEAKYLIADDASAATGSQSGSGFHPLAGAGITMGFAEIYALRLEAIRVFDAGKDDTGGEGDIDLLNIGVTVSF